METRVPPVPPPQNAQLIGSLSTLVMILGVVLVLCALPPVRAAAGDFIDRLTRSGRYRPRPNRRPAANTATPAEPAAAPQPNDTRREIEEFDLDIFSGV